MPEHEKDPTVLTQCRGKIEHPGMITKLGHDDKNMQVLLDSAPHNRDGECSQAKPRAREACEEKHQEMGELRSWALASHSEWLAISHKVNTGD